jgi:probable rRNA maturation factor
MLDALTGMNDPSGSGRLQAPDCVELVLVHDAAMAARNARHLGRGGPTNVLAFPASGDVPGCLILSLDTALREAVLYGQAPSRHVMWLLAHGAGHLVGLDHGDAMDRLCREAFSRGLAALGA